MGKERERKIYLTGDEGFGERKGWIYASDVRGVEREDIMGFLSSKIYYVSCITINGRINVVSHESKRFIKIVYEDLCEFLEGKKGDFHVDQELMKQYCKKIEYLWSGIERRHILHHL